MEKPRYWTSEEIDTLKRLRAEGKDINVCSAILNRSKNSVRHRLYDKKEHFVLAKEYGRKLTEEEEQWVIAHYHNIKNADIQRRFGISFSHLHLIARKHGLKKTSQFLKKTQRNASEAAARSHIANGTYPHKGYQIPGSEKTRFQKGVSNEMRLGKARNRKCIEKSRDSLALRRKREAALVFCGLPQKTKLRVVVESKEKKNYRYGLRKHGYIQDEKDKNLFYFPADGTRHLVRERNGQKHGIRFRSLTEPPSKVRSDDIHFVKMETIFGEAEKKRKKSPPVEAFGQSPISSSIVSSLDAYNCESSFLYDV